MDELFVSPDHRGAGIGRRAKSLYARQGFTDTRRTLMQMDVKR